MQKMKKIVTSIAIVLLACSLCIPVFAAYTDTLNEQQHDLQDQIQETTLDLTQIQGKLTEALKQIQELTDTINQKEQELKNLDTQGDSLDIQIGETQAKLNEVQNNYNIQKGLMDERIVAIYEGGEISYLDVLLKSASLSDFISNYYKMSELASYDSELVSRIAAQKEEIESYKTRLQDQRKELEKLKTTRETEYVMLQNTQKLKTKYMAELTDSEKEIQAKLDKYNADLQQVENEIRIANAYNNDYTYTGGIMAWPTPGYTRITSPFGMRVHPITGVYKLHTGTDIGAPTGASFIAAADGIVSAAYYSVAYGNMVIVNHGSGISTLYAHGSQIMVKAGQEVKRGDVVLKVGSTGYATGPHAHFEVRVNGEYQDPIPYITTNVNKEE